MTYLIAAAGTGGHVYPGLSVGEALLDRGVARDDIMYVGGHRLEAKVYPELGFPFLQLDIRGLQRSASPANLGIPAMLIKARRTVESIIEERGIRAVLGMGGYVTVPVGMAARKCRVPFFCSEQNAEAGLATRVVSRWARTTFTSFPSTGRLTTGTWVGNPVRSAFWDFDRETTRSKALADYGLSEDLPVLGVFGGSLGAGVLNKAVADLASGWGGSPIQVLHLTGARFIEDLIPMTSGDRVVWVRIGFEDHMENFYAASDVVLARAGGAVAELTATGTPSILVPGAFGSGGHQEGNARFLDSAGAAIVLPESELHRLPEVVTTTLLEPDRLEQMRDASKAISRPRAAHEIAAAMIEAAR